MNASAMIPTALIVFREVMEAALIVSIILAATRGIKSRGWWVSMGIVGGVIGAGIIGSIITTIAGMFDGSGQEIVNAAILLLAVGLIAWHVIWMNSHGKELSRHMRNVGASVTDGTRHMSILAVVVGLAVMREGAEIVMMLQGLGTSGSTISLYSGSAVGFLFGVALGAGMYFGLIALSISQMFAATNLLLILIASGMAARAANFLSQADWLPTLGQQIWDTSFILSDSSLLGQVLSTLIGYTAQPTGIQFLFYSISLITITTLMRLANKPAKHKALPEA